MANRWFFTGLVLVASLATAIVYGLGANFVINGVITIGHSWRSSGCWRSCTPLTALSNVRVDVMTAW